MDTKQNSGPARVPQRTSLVASLLLCAFSAFAIVILVVLVISVGLRTYEQVRPDESKLYTSEYAEWAAAQGEHDKILALSQECPSERALKLDDRFTVITPSGRRMSGLPRVATPLFVAPGYLLAAIDLSFEIGQARVDLAREQVLEDISMQVFAWVGVLVGALTTILISVKSMMTTDRMPMQFSIGAAAIVFAALGTAVAGLNSFYTPKIAYDRTTRSLATLRQLHEELATGMMREQQASLCQNLSWPNDWRYKRIKGLTDQYIAVVAATQLTAPQPEGDATEEPPSTPLPGKPRR